MKSPVVIIIAVVVIIPVIVLLAGQFSKSPTTATTPTPTAKTSPTPNASAMAENPVSAHKVILQTSMGDISLDLYPEDAPLAVKNFVTLGSGGYYKDVIFHRVIKDFMDQAGDPTGTGSGGESIYGKYFKTEINSHKFVAGTLGAARTNAMDTNGSQFFITATAYPSLDGQYTVFGQVSDDQSLSIVKKINEVATDSNDKPLQPVTITGFQIIAQ